MALFLSTFVNKVDKKGRVSVPAQFRAALADQSFNGIVAIPAFRLNAIQAFDYESMQGLSEGVDALELFSEEQTSLAAAIFADAHQLPFDGEGRIVLPKELAGHARITDLAAFVGQGRYFEIWEPEAARTHRERSREQARRQGMTLRLHRPGDEGGGRR